MTTLEIILIAIMWIAYGCFNSWQYDWFEYDFDQPILAVFFNIVIAPISLTIRIFRGVFYWKGKNQ